MNLEPLTKNKVVRLISDTVSSFMKDGALRLSAALAYYSIFSIAPLLIIAISIAGWVFGSEANHKVSDQLAVFVGTDAAEAVEAMIESASKPSDSLLGGIIGFFTLMLGASGIFGQLKDALNTIWEVKPKTGTGIMGFVKERFLNFGMVLVIGFLLLTSLLLSTGIAAANKFLGTILNVPAAIWGVAAFAISLGTITVLFAFIFKVLPDAKIQWRNVWVGAGITALLFEVGQFALGIYLGKESTTSSFGAAGSVVLLLLWVYYASCILLFGAEFTQVYARSTGHVIGPAENARPVTQEERVDEGMAVRKQDPRIPMHIPAPAPQPATNNFLGELFGELVLATAGSFALGLLVRRKPVTTPLQHIQTGLSGLRDQASTETSRWLKRQTKKLRS